MQYLPRRIEECEYVQAMGDFFEWADKRYAFLDVKKNVLAAF